MVSQSSATDGCSYGYFEQARKSTDISMHINEGSKERNETYTPGKKRNKSVATEANDSIATTTVVYKQKVKGFAGKPPKFDGNN